MEFCSFVPTNLVSRTLSHFGYVPHLKAMTRDGRGDVFVDEPKFGRLTAMGTSLPESEPVIRRNHP